MRIVNKKKFFSRITILAIILILPFFIVSMIPNQEKNTYKKVFENVSVKKAKITKYFIYGTMLNIEGTIEDISKENLENVKLIITDGKDFEQIEKMDYEFKENKFYFKNTTTINNAINLDKLPVNDYYLLIRLKLNNSASYRYFLLENTTEYASTQYYTVTRNEKNNEINIYTKNFTYKKSSYDYLGIDVKESTLPENVYDIVVDAGHGGKDSGEVYEGVKESDLTLKVGNKLAENLINLGLKVKVTRDEKNDASITATNMYDDDGRINVACSSKAKYMISIHVNNGKNDLSGVEVYIPCKSDTSLAKLISSKIEKMANTNYSNFEQFKVEDGVYQKNFTKNMINDFAKSCSNKGFEPYSINNNTPYLYSIREVGGIATNAYVDGRNETYGTNKYIKSNTGIESYQVEMGYIKTDAENIDTNFALYAKAMAEAIEEFLSK